MNNNPIKTRLETASNYRPPTVSSEIEQDQAATRGDTEYGNPFTNPFTTTIPPPFGSVTPTPGFAPAFPNSKDQISEEKITVQLNASRAHGAAQNVHIQALETQRRALDAVKEREDHLKAAQKNLDDAKKVAEEGGNALKQAKQALEKTWKELNESMS